MGAVGPQQHVDVLDGRFTVLGSEGDPRPVSPELHVLECHAPAHGDAALGERLGEEGLGRGLRMDQHEGLGIDAGEVDTGDPAAAPPQVHGPHPAPLVQKAARDRRPLQELEAPRVHGERPRMAGRPGLAVDDPGANPPLGQEERG